MSQAFAEIRQFRKCLDFPQLPMHFRKYRLKAERNLNMKKKIFNIFLQRVLSLKKCKSCLIALQINKIDVCEGKSFRVGTGEL